MSTLIYTNREGQRWELKNVRLPEVPALALAGFVVAERPDGRTVVVHRDRMERINQEGAQS